MPWPKGKPAHNRIEQPSPTTRICKKCGEEKDEKEGFYGRSHKCRVCTVSDQQASYCPDKKRDQNLRTKYGIGIEEYNELYAQQEGKCAICETTDPGKGGRKSGRGGSMKHFCVDHDHKTGEVRGLLCYGCNMFIGNVGENKDWLHNAVAFLEKYERHEDGHFYAK